MAGILVLGVGNLLLQDEGVGVHLINRLKERKDLSEDIELLDGGTASLELLSYIEGFENLIIVDALKAGKAPGTIYKFDGQDMPKRPDNLLSLHELDLSHTLSAAKQLNILPKRIVVIGIEPKAIDYGLELSKELKDRLPQLEEEVIKEINEIRNKNWSA